MLKFILIFPMVLCIGCAGWTERYNKHYNELKSQGGAGISLGGLIQQGYTQHQINTLKLQKIGK